MGYVQQTEGCSNSQCTNHDCSSCIDHFFTYSMRGSLHAINRSAWLQRTNTLFIKCRKLNGPFKHSSADTNGLRSCSESELPLYTLQQDVPTRCNSISIIMQSLLQAKDALNTYISKYGKTTVRLNCWTATGKRCWSMWESRNCFVRLLHCLVEENMSHALMFYHCYHCLQSIQQYMMMTQAT